MAKIHTTLSIDEEVIKKAKEKNLNMSEVTEQALKNELNIINLEINEPSRCEFCGVEMEKQTADDLTKGLCWLYPDERWICPTCLNTKKRLITAGKRY